MLFCRWLVFIAPFISVNRWANVSVLISVEYPGHCCYHTRSIFGGLMVHLGIAWLMELEEYWFHTCQTALSCQTYKKLQADKPDSVLPLHFLRSQRRSGYHLSAPILTHQDQSAYPGSRTSSSQTNLYVAFQHARFTRMYDHSYKL